MKESGRAALYAVIFVLTTTFCVLRTAIDIQRYRRISSLSILGSLLIFAFGWVCFTTSMACALWVVVQTIEITEEGHAANGFFIPSAGVGLYDLPIAIKMSSIVPGFMLVVALWSVKFSFYIMNFNLVRHLPKKILWCLIALGVYLALSFVGNMLAIGLWCVPISKEWAIMDNCSAFTNSRSATIYTAMNVSSDIFTMAVPLAILRTLKLNRRDRWGFAFLIALGTFTVAATIVRTILVVSVGNDTSKGLSASPTKSRAADIMAYVEVSAALIAASLPSFRSKRHHIKEKERQRAPKRSNGTVTIGGSGQPANVNAKLNESSESKTQLSKDETLLETESDVYNLEYILPENDLKRWESADSRPKFSGLSERDD